MKSLSLALLGSLLFLAGGCSQFIADQVLIPHSFPKRVAMLKKEGKEVEQRWGDKMKFFAYDSFDGTRIRGAMFFPQETPKGVIVVLHGLTDMKEAMYSVSEAFARAGYLAVTPDLRAHGQSGGRYTTLGDRERRDQVALLNYLQGQGYDVQHAGVLGGSLGAAVAIQWAAIDPRIKAIIAVAPFAELSTEVEFLARTRHVPEWEIAIAKSAVQQQGKFRVENISPLNSLKAMETPLYLAHGFADGIIPQSESQRLFEAARGPVIFQKTISGHADIKRALGDRFVLRSVDWMNLYVPADAKPGPFPAWVNNYGTRNIATEPPVATTN